MSVPGWRIESAWVKCKSSQTKTSYNIINIAGGMFHYCGIQNSIGKILDKSVVHTVPQTTFNCSWNQMVHAPARVLVHCFGMMKIYQQSIVDQSVLWFFEAKLIVWDSKYLQNLIQEWKCWKVGFYSSRKPFLWWLFLLCVIPKPEPLSEVWSHTVQIMDVTSVTKRMSTNLIKLHFLRSVQCMEMMAVLDKQQMKNTNLSLTTCRFWHWHGCLLPIWFYARGLSGCNEVSLRFVDLHHWPLALSHFI